MSLGYALKPKMKLPLPSLAPLLLLSLCAWPLDTARAQDVVRLTLNIKVVDESGKPVANAHVLIPRQGKNNEGQSLKDVEAETNSDGELVRESTDFELIGVPHRVIVTAPESPRPTAMVLTDDMLRNAFDSNNKLSVDIPLGKESSALPLSPTDASAAHSTQGSGWFRGALNYAIWLLAALFLLLLAAAITAWRLGYRLTYPRAAYKVRDSLVGVASPATESVSDGLRQIHHALASLENQQVESRKRLDVLVSQVVKNNDILKRGVTVISIREESESSSANLIMEREAPIQHEPVRPDATPPRPTFYKELRSAYWNLLNREPVTSEPIYLNVEAARSIAGRLEDANVYLSEVNHSQGAFVLFTDSNKSGWLFPNPKVSYRQAALKDVFPALTQAEFEDSKESIQPKRVRKVEEGRWMVEPS
jgi:hypothetical protein